VQGIKQPDVSSIYPNDREEGWRNPSPSSPLVEAVTDWGSFMFPSHRYPLETDYLLETDYPLATDYSLLLSGPSYPLATDLPSSLSSYGRSPLEKLFDKLTKEHGELLANLLDLEPLERDVTLDELKKVWMWRKYLSRSTKTPTDL